MQFLPPKGSFERCRLYLLYPLALIISLGIGEMCLDAKHAEEAIGRPFYTPPHHDITGPLCVIILISMLPACFREAWQKMNASEKRIRQLEEKVEKLLAEKPERESTAVQVSNAPDDRYFSPR